MTLYLSRLALAHTPATAALRELLDPNDGGLASDAHHRLLWALFADDPDRRRDFLWRGEGQGRFLALSARPPRRDGAGLFEPPEVKEFTPDLRTGDRLGFVLRANATRTVKTGEQSASGKEKKVHRDVVMEAIHPLPSGREPGQRAYARMILAREKGAGWLAGQGASHGFRPLQVEVSDYSVVALPAHARSRRGQPQFGVLELSGTLEVADPAAFLARLALGFGRAKAFGCGLMLIRRAG